MLNSRAILKQITHKSNDSLLCCKFLHWPCLCLFINGLVKCFGLVKSFHSWKKCFLQMVGRKTLGAMLHPKFLSLWAAYKLLGHHVTIFQPYLQRTCWSWYRCSCAKQCILIELYIATCIQYGWKQISPWTPHHINEAYVRQCHIWHDTEVCLYPVCRIIPDLASIWMLQHVQISFTKWNFVF